jgi:hypothetical protein
VQLGKRLGGLSTSGAGELGVLMVDSLRLLMSG